MFNNFHSMHNVKGSTPYKPLDDSEILTKFAKG